MLSFLRYLSIFTFIIICGGAFFAGTYFRQMATDALILSPTQEESKRLAGYFEKNIWCTYQSRFQNLRQYPIEDWNQHRDFAALKKLLNLTLSSTHYAKVSIYQDEKQFFTTAAMEPTFLEPQGTNSIPQNLRDKKAVTNLIYASMGSGDRSALSGHFVQSYVEVSTQSCSDYEGSPSTIVLEFYQDVSAAYEKVAALQKISSGGIVAIFILLYATLYFTSKKAEKIIDKQHEEKLKLEKEKSRAEAQNQQKSMFLANVSHELRTPLNAIIGFSEIIKDEVMGSVGHPQYKEYINDINASGVHLLSLINDILDYSKAEARKLDIDLVDVDITKIVSSCLRLVEPRANEAKVHLIEDLPGHHVLLKADPKRMKQIILNLLSNAVKFTPEDGRVTITVKDEPLDGEVTIIVSDTGIGISQKDISKAMAPFGQIDSSLSRRYEGTGLGLPLTKKLTEIMNGRFDIKSEVGLGTTVILVMPTIKNENSGAKANQF